MTQKPEQDALYKWLARDGNNGDEKIAMAERRQHFFFGIFAASLVFCLASRTIEPKETILLFQFALVIAVIGLVLAAHFANQSHQLKEERKRLIRAQGKALLER